MKSIVRDLLWTALFALIAFFALRLSIQTFRVDMPSMRPTIEPGYWVVVNKISYRFGSPERGDIVVLKAPVDPSVDFIKRLIAVPGDTVEVKNNKVYVNSKPLNEPYLANPPHYVLPIQTIPPDEYFVLGDNRDISVDSHYGWLVPRDKLIGKAWLVVWPPEAWGLAPNYGLAVTSLATP